MSPRHDPAPGEPPPGTCPNCGGKRARDSFEAHGLRAGDPRYRLRRCEDCGLGWTHPPVPDSEIERWYPESYYGRNNVRFNRLFEALIRLFRLRRATMISRLAAPGPVLDVGCGRGFTLSMLRDRGYEPHGVELSETAARHARQRLGIDVYVGDFLEAPYPPEHFSAVIFWHSLEHFRLPVQALRHARRLLKPGGLLVVAVPNSESLQASWFGPYWFHLDIPRHYFHFGERCLRSLLERHGFRVAERAHFSFEQNPYGWLQTLYNALGLEFNLLYSILKNRTARIAPIRKHFFQALVVAALLPSLLPLSVTLTLLEALLKRGGTIEVYAIKQ